MQFNKVIGQYQLKQNLINSVKSGRVPHAILMLGNEGVGALPLALAYIQFIVCEAKTDVDACGVCSACKKVQKHIHPDIHFTMPVVKNDSVTYKAGDGARSIDWVKEWRTAILENPYLNFNDWMQLQVGDSNSQGNITKDECKDILSFLNLKSFESGYKFIVIWMAEYLGNDGNRLLKQIEEPEPGTHFIIIAENYDQILGTIQSRTQLIKLLPLSETEIAKALIENKQLEERDAKSIAQIADGSYNTALKLITENGNQFETFFLDWMQLILKNQQRDWPTIADQFAKLGREAQKNLVKYALVLMRKTMLVQSGGVLETNNDRENGFCNFMAKKLSIHQISKTVSIFNQMHFEIERNANPKILFIHHSFQLQKAL